MANVEYTLKGHVALVTLNDGENRFNPPFLDAYIAVLDQIEAETDARVLVARSSHEKIFCNGIDLEWLAPIIQKGEIETAKAFFYQLNRLFHRLVTYPLITVAAINGHAFAGGAIMACGFDFRFMQTGRGFFCFPEVDLGIPFLPGMNAMLCKAMPMDTVVEMELTGVRLTAEQCRERGIVHKASPPEKLLADCLEFGRALKKERPVIAEMKNRLYRPIIHAIEVEDGPYIESGRYNIG
ncbi:MAG: enoyl-CoA hydratase/isomerase family protein [Desulfobacterales bacterium]|nr:enoyl-CoA hydratase/isomerase family protein [Desulfobacterales bacterium]